MEKRIKGRGVDAPAPAATPDPLLPGNAFQGVVGQATAVGVLGAALRHDTVAHAYLFTGPAGVGRELTARRLAAALLCTGRAPDAAPDQVCGGCANCRRVPRGLHPDVHLCLPEAEWVARGMEWTEDRRPSPEIKVEQVRTLRDALRMASFEGGWRVAIIPHADRMRVEAANALLKTLEEPLPRSLLVLCAPDRRSVLETLVSRCQRVPFAPLEERVLAELLVRQRGLDGDTAAAVAREASGSVSRALAEDPTTAAQAWDAAQQWLEALRGAAPAALAERAEELTLEKHREALDGHVQRLSRLAAREAELRLERAAHEGAAAQEARFLTEVAQAAVALQGELARPGVNARLAVERFCLQLAAARPAVAASARPR